MQKISHTSANMWNLKEKNYPKFSFENCQFQKEIIKTTQIWGVEYNDKIILEVGCGTGAYTFILAKTAKFVDALDFSEQMLKVLKNDAIKFKLSDKIHCIHEDFSKFKNDKFYDIAFAAMTPALFDEDCYFKFNKLAKTKVWLGWAGKRDSKLMSEIFKAHGKEIHAHNTSEILKKWLEKREIVYKNKVFETVWRSELSFEDMVEDQAWHLKIHKIEPNLEYIKEIVSKFVNEKNRVINKTDVRLEMLLW